MNIDRVLEYHEEICNKARDLMRDKSHDYAGTKDAFGNFRLCERLDVCDTATGIMVRLSDKFSRLSQLHHNQPKVKDEAVEDTVEDLINYAIIYLLVRQEAQPDRVPVDRSHVDPDLGLTEKATQIMGNTLNRIAKTAMAPSVADPVEQVPLWAEKHR